MTIRIEFFGIPRQRAGTAAIEVEAGTLGEALDQAGRLLPAFSDACLADGRLKPGYQASVNARTFTNERSTPLHAGDAVLILSADAGG